MTWTQIVHSTIRSCKIPLSWARGDTIEWLYRHTLLSEILKTITGLNHIRVDSDEYNVSDQGRTNVFRALRCNTTLTGSFYFKGIPLFDDSHSKLIKDHIDSYPKWIEDHISFNHRRKTIATSLYSYLIRNKLSKKPQFLDEFLQSETPILVGAAPAATITGKHHQQG